MAIGRRQRRAPRIEIACAHSRPGSAERDLELGMASFAQFDETPLAHGSVRRRSCAQKQQAETLLTQQLDERDRLANVGGEHEIALARTDRMRAELEPVDEDAELTRPVLE